MRHHELTCWVCSSIYFLYALPSLKVIGMHVYMKKQKERLGKQSLVSSNDDDDNVDNDILCCVD